MKGQILRTNSILGLRFRLFILFAFSLFASCNSSSIKILLQDKRLPQLEVIDYSGDIYRGNFISVIKGNENSVFRYSIEVDENGKVLHVNKNENKYFDRAAKNIEMFRGLQLLVTDTAWNDPAFFGNPVSGYYTDAYIINNVINAPNPKIILSSLSADEKEMFRRIDSLADERNIKFSGLDTANVLGWFKYVF
jgi:hypothetical protein